MCIRDRITSNATLHTTNPLLQRDTRSTIIAVGVDRRIVQKLKKYCKPKDGAYREACIGFFGRKLIIGQNCQKKKSQKPM